MNKKNNEVKITDVSMFSDVGSMFSLSSHPTMFSIETKSLKRALSIAKKFPVKNHKEGKVPTFSLVYEKPDTEIDNKTQTAVFILTDKISGDEILYGVKKIHSGFKVFSIERGRNDISFVKIKKGVVHYKFKGKQESVDLT